MLFLNENYKNKYPKHKKKYGKPGKKYPPTLKIKPAADSQLKRVFSNIGVPAKKEFKPDRFQLDAVSAIDKGDCLVTAPTGSGKTWIAVQAIEKVIGRGGKAWYASPLKALTNAKYREFIEEFGEDAVGILTGDRKENPDASIIAGTTEILRNQLYDAMHKGEFLESNLVILDEAHYLGDEDRGVVWEEIMIYLPVRIPILMLSATIGNAFQIADWLSGIRGKEAIVVEETRRPVPLVPLFFHPTGKLYPLMSRDKRKKTKKINQKVGQYLQLKRPPLLSPPTKLPPMGDIIKVLRKYRLLPAIFFLKSRADCDNALELCRENYVEDPERREKLENRVDELVSKSEHVASHRQLWHLKNLAVGSHHSGQLPAWKLVVENLMTEGKLDAVFATSTVAAGVDFPARTVVFFNSDRFNGKEFVTLDPTEFHQMTGRAGRRGKDNIGFAVAIPGKFMDLREIARLVVARPSFVISQIKINFSMVLNLLLSHTPSEIEELLERSFATYLIGQDKQKKKIRKHAVDIQRNLIEDFFRHLEFLKETGYVTEDGRLTYDGEWASQLRVDQPILIAEGFRQGVFPDSNPPLLAAIIASFVNEQEMDERIDRDIIARHLWKTFHKIKSELKPFVYNMHEKGFEVRPLFIRPAVTIHAWADGLPWEKVVAISEMAEGNLAMLILRTADNLRHIKALSRIFPEAADTAEKAIEAIMRDPIATIFEM